MAIDVAKSIRLCVDSGEVRMGAKNALKLALKADQKLLVLASNCPQHVAEDLKRACGLSQVPVLDFKGTSMELGVVCGKPFPISALSVLNEGDSDILQAVKTSGETVTKQ